MTQHNEHDKAAIDELRQRVAALEEKLAACRETNRGLREFRTIVNRSPAVAILWQASEGWPVEFVSDSIRQFGYTPDDLLSGRVSWMNIIHPEDVPRLQAEVAASQEGQAASFDQEYRILTNTGGVRWVTDHTVGRFDAEGNLTHFESIFLDITARRRTEEDYRTSEIKFRSLFEMSPQAIALSEVESGRIIDVNNKFCRMAGLDREQIIGRSSLELGFYGADERARLVAELKEAGEVSGREMEFRTASGTPLTALLFSRLINIDAQSLLLTAVIDISAQKRLESNLQQMQKMEAIGTLAGGIAHDFNNILTAIIGFTQLTKYNIGDNQAAAEKLDKILSACNRAKELVKQVLTFSRQQEQKPEPVDIAPIIKEAIKLLRASLPSTISIRPSINERTRPIIADPTQVYQVLMNLCSNAAQAMAEEGGELEIDLDELELDRAALSGHEGLEPGYYLRLRVRDSGPGMDRQTLARIFEPFFTTRGVGKGTGMGLAVVHGIVQSHRGFVTVDSAPGQGATFDIFIPCTERRSVRKEREKAILVPHGHERLLFVDDEESVVEACRQILEVLGYEVEAFTASKEALERFREDPDGFDLVITDQTMPGLTGTRLAEEILRIRPEVPIILCTGYSEEITLAKARAIGIRDLIMKPASEREIATLIRTVLNRDRKVSG